MNSVKVPRLATSSICRSCREQHFPLPRRPFGTTSARRATNSLPPPPPPPGGLSSLSSSLRRNADRPRGSNNASNANASMRNLEILDLPQGDAAESLLSDTFGQNLNAAVNEGPYRLHILATKHNTHITLVQPPKAASLTISSAVSGTSASATDQKKVVDVVLSLSAGNIGFRKAGRGSYDAAYQLAAFALKQMKEKGISRGIKKLEVVLRGFGAGREAVTKALLGAEGQLVRGKITAVVDATRLKLGGPRSPKPRRLG